MILVYFGDYKNVLKSQCKHNMVRMVTTGLWTFKWTCDLSHYSAYDIPSPNPSPYIFVGT